MHRYLVNRYYDPATDQFLAVDPLVGETGQAFSYANGDPVNESDPLGLWGWNPIADYAQASHDVTSAVQRHWRGLTKVAITVGVLVAGSACVAATAGVCGALAFGIGGFELSGGAIAVGAVLGAGTGAADYSIDAGRHNLGGYLNAAGWGAARDAAFFGLPEEAIFGGLGEGAHSAQLGFCGALRNLPGYLRSAFK